MRTHVLQRRDERGHIERLRAVPVGEPVLGPRESVEVASVPIEKAAQPGSTNSRKVASISKLMAPVKKRKEAFPSTKRGLIHT